MTSNTITEPILDSINKDTNTSAELDNDDINTPQSNKQKHFQQLQKKLFETNPDYHDIDKKKLKQVITYYLKEIHCGRLMNVVINIKQSYKQPYLLFMSHGNNELLKIQNPLLTFKYVHIKNKDDWELLTRVFLLFTKLLLNKYSSSPILLNITALYKYLTIIEFDLTKIRYAEQTHEQLEYIYLPFKQTKNAITEYTLVSSVIKDSYIFLLVTELNNRFINKVRSPKTYIKVYKKLSIEEIEKGYIDNKKIYQLPIKDIYNGNISKYHKGYKLNTRKNTNLLFVNRKDIDAVTYLKKAMKNFQDTEYGIVLLTKRQEELLIIKVVYYFKNTLYESFTYRPFIKYYQGVVRDDRR